MSADPLERTVRKGQRQEDKVSEVTTAKKWHSEVFFLKLSSEAGLRAQDYNLNIQVADQGHRG